MSTNFSRAGAFAKLVGVLCIALASNPAHGQDVSLAHFVAPGYPALARQAMISGQVVLRLGVGADGKILEVRDEASSHQLLTQEVKTTVREWEFQPRLRAYSVSVTVYFAFSGTTREYNPRTVVKADFAASTIRVYVTTDGVPTVRP